MGETRRFPSHFMPKSGGFQSMRANQNQKDLFSAFGTVI
jgi:hypothetical protein